MVHGLNKGHITPYTDIKIQLRDHYDKIQVYNL